jgi:hypothetical protein
MDPEPELLKIMSAGELEARISEKIQSFHGFLTREVALRLIAREAGLLKTEEKEWRLGEIPRGEKRIAFTGKVKWVWPAARYSSGKRSRVVEVGDDTGSKPLILWNDDVELASKLRMKDVVRVRGAYEKGGELHLGYSGTLEVLSKAEFSRLDDLREGEHVHLRGAVSRVEGEDSFVRGMGTVRGFSFIISDGGNERRCVIFEGGGIERGRRLREGDEVIIEGAMVSGGNVEIGPDTRMLSRRAHEMLLGEVESIECAAEGENESLAIRVGGKEARRGRESALRFLRAEVAPDIALSTVVSLKKDTLLNTRIALRIEQKDGQTVVR